MAGGTKVASAYRLVNEIVKEESLETDYNIYVFHGTDGDDWDTDGKETVPELKKMLTFANRVGITVARHAFDALNPSEVEKYIKNSKLLYDKPDLLRMDVMKEYADNRRAIIRECQDQGGNGTRALQPRLRELREDTERQVESILTWEQMVRWRELMDEEEEKMRNAMKQERQGGGRSGGRGGGGGKGGGF